MHQVPKSNQIKYLGSDAAVKSIKQRKLTTNTMVVCDDFDLEEIFSKNVTNSKTTSVITNDS